MHCHVFDCRSETTISDAYQLELLSCFWRDDMLKMCAMIFELLVSTSFDAAFCDIEEDSSNKRYLVSRLLCKRASFHGRHSQAFR